MVKKGAILITGFIFLSESHHPTIQRKRARNVSEEAKENISHSEPDKKRVLGQALTRPLRMLILSPIVTGLSLYLALIYGYLYLLFTTFSTVFPQQYGFKTDKLGLAFLGLGVGCILALAILSWLSDWLHERLTKKHGKEKPEYAIYRTSPVMFHSLTFLVDTDCFLLL